MTAPTHLRVEHLDHAFGITVSTPRLSWRLPPGTRHQLAYRVRAGTWDSGRVTSTQALLVPYRGTRLRSGERVEWTVKVWTDAGESDWAEPAWWEMGLLEPADWVAEWIAPAEADRVRAQVPHPVWTLRRTFVQAGRIERARLYATAQGMYEFFINGYRVGDLELTPGFTSYRRTLHVQAFDVTSLVHEGENVLGAILSGGWLKWAPLYRDGGPELALFAQVNLHTVDGSLRRVATDRDWLAATCEIQSADLQQGQVVDLRKRRRGWCTRAAGTQGWSAVTVRAEDRDRLRSSPAPPVRRIQELRPVTVTELRPGRYVVDLGQNINGWLRVTSLGPEDTTIALTHGEALDSDGDVTVRHIAGLDRPSSLPFQRDEVTSAGRAGDTFEPRHTTHGFRYVRIEGHPGPASEVDLAGVVVHSDLRRTGWFECSDERINRLHEAVVWSFRGNACDVPTDCPTRERAGWTGDWQIFVATAAFLFDVAGFATKWLRDLASEQQADGVVLHCAPADRPSAWHAHHGFPPGSAGWGDAAVIVPWEIYRAYGDADLLAAQWESMTAWVDYAARIAREQRHPSRVSGRPSPAAHDEFLWDTGFHWGEWSEPGMLPSELDAAVVARLIADLRAADHGNVATAYLHQSARLLAKSATVLGREECAERYGELAVSASAAWQCEFLRPGGTVAPETQANVVRSLAFDLIPERLRTDATDQLVRLIREAGTHLATGFLSTPHILPVLADQGRIGLAYELLLQDTEPSWLTMVDRGATTMWEQWNGLDGDGVPHDSLNHYSKGAVASFLHRYTAGIRLHDDAAAYRRFIIRPVPGGGLTYARATHDCPYGRIGVAWSVAGSRFALEATIPPGTSAEVHLPDGQTFEAAPGETRYTCDVDKTVVMRGSRQR